METKNAILVDLNEIPQPQREALQRKAIHDGKPLSAIIVEAVLDRPRRILAYKPPTHRRAKASA